MKMWTQGLGKIELVVNARDMEAEKIEGKTVMTGITEEPIQWNYTITLEKEDIPAVLHVLLQYNTLFWVFRNKGLVFKSILGAIGALFSKKKVNVNKAMGGNAT